MNTHPEPSNGDQDSANCKKGIVILFGFFVLNSAINKWQKALYSTFRWLLSCFFFEQPQQTEQFVTALFPFSWVILTLVPVKFTKLCCCWRICWQEWYRKSYWFSKSCVWINFRENTKTLRRTRSLSKILWGKVKTSVCMVRRSGTWLLSLVAVFSWHLCQIFLL